eukprot:TRINITY_DN48148_c0_g1_i1.p1 TRINITY_DN48148_c0_g1~~TRINITY_DN48148_c0_g1_i1.p1  ORF type:complete len:483 (-),score=93.90 TRINITY_DN48148_c0_g1_i1:116-1564(-)
MFTAHYSPGERIGSYEVVQFLGRGSFGVVLLGQSEHRELFALKLVPCDHLDDKEAERTAATTLAEAELTRRLRHPHIVTCYEVQYDPFRKFVWLALDFMDGGDLQNMIKARKLSGRGFFEGSFLHRILSAVGSALCYIHSEGVLHRDVKPANVLVRRGVQEIKLADFGISKLLEASGHAGTILGTPAYMSPEIVSGKPYGPPADAWAFGALLHELASLQRPFEASNQLALVWQIVEHAPPELPSETPRDVVEVIRGLLDKDPDQRLRLEDLGLEIIHGLQEPMSPDSSPLGRSSGKDSLMISGQSDLSGYAGANSSGAAISMSDWSAGEIVPDVDGHSSYSLRVADSLPSPRSPRSASHFSGPPVPKVSGRVESRASSEGLCDLLAQEIEPARRMPPSVSSPFPEGGDLEEVMLQEVEPIQIPAPASPRTAGLGIAFGEPAAAASPRRNWLSRLGRGLRYGMLGQTREQAVVSAFHQDQIQD